MAATHSVEELWEQLWERFQNIYVISIPEYTEVMAFTDDVRLYYDGADPLYCDVCGGYIEEDYTVNGKTCPHVVKGTGETLLSALEDICVRQST